MQIIKKTKNASILSKGSNNNFNDRIYTPKEIVIDIIKWVKPTGKILEPFRGKGAFYDELLKIDEICNNYAGFGSEIKSVYYTEIDEGKDFFKFNHDVDYIITNPPYSIFTQVLEHSMKIADNIILLIPLNKIYTSDKRMNMLEEYMGKDINNIKIKRFKVPKDWTAKFPIGAVWIKKAKND